MVQNQVIQTLHKEVADYRTKEQDILKYFDIDPSVKREEARKRREKEKKASTQRARRGSRSRITPPVDLFASLPNTPPSEFTSPLASPHTISPSAFVPPSVVVPPDSAGSSQTVSPISPPVISPETNIAGLEIFGVKVDTIPSVALVPPPETSPPILPPQSDKSGLEIFFNDGTATPLGESPAAGSGLELFQSQQQPSLFVSQSNLFASQSTLSPVVPMLTFTPSSPRTIHAVEVFPEENGTPLSTSSGFHFFPPSPPASTNPIPETPFASSGLEIFGATPKLERGLSGNSLLQNGEANSFSPKLEGTFAGVLNARVKSLELDVEKWKSLYFEQVEKNREQGVASYVPW